MFSIRVANDDLFFAAAHFITIRGGQCERLHGHTYHVAAEIKGSLDEHHYVADFVAVRKILKTILADLDHHVILPAHHATIRVVPGTEEVEVTWTDRRWVFPKADCLILPIASTTTELLAEYVARRLLAELKVLTDSHCVVHRVRIEMGEGTGFSAACELQGDDLA
jgi:6-pyruvoyltetrahydropterin/6-carboxytetrahydropterin synthase